eukprot:1013682-Ditylum_brightwellii.AAC.1
MQAHRQLMRYLAKKEAVVAQQRNELHELHQKLTIDEEQILLDTCMKFVDMGYSIDELSLLEITNQIICPGPANVSEDF